MQRRLFNGGPVLAAAATQLHGRGLVPVVFSEGSTPAKRRLRPTHRPRTRTHHGDEPVRRSAVPRAISLGRSVSRQAGGRKQRRQTKHASEQSVSREESSKAGATQLNATNAVSHSHQAITPQVLVVMAVIRMEQCRVSIPPPLQPDDRIKAVEVFKEGFESAGS